VSLKVAGRAVQQKRYLAEFNCANPQRRNGHACAFVGRILVLDDGERRMFW
jgi:hypothetical protein